MNETSLKLIDYVYLKAVLMHTCIVHTCDIKNDDVLKNNNSVKTLQSFYTSIVISPLLV